MKLTFEKIYLIGLIAVAIYCIFLFKGCNDNPQVNTKPDNSIQYAKEDSINKKMAQFALDKKKLEDENDSLKIVLSKRMSRKTRVKDSLIFVSDSSCIISLIALYNESERTDSTYNMVISNLIKQKGIDSLNTLELIKKVNIKQERVAKDSTYIEHLCNDSIPLIYQKRFWKGYFKGFSHGFATGVGVTKGVDVLVK